MLTGKEILQALNDKQLTFTDIARLLGVTPLHIHNVAHRKAYSARIARALSIAIGQPFEKVFDDQPQYHQQYRQRPVVDLVARAKHRQAAQEALAAAGYLLTNRRESSR